MPDIFRRDFTIYVKESDGSESVLFHLAAPDQYQIANADKLVELALMMAEQAPPVVLFFK